MFCFNVLFLSKRFRSSPSWICFGLKCFPRRYSRKPNGWNLQMEVWWMILLFYRGGCSRSTDLRGVCQFWKKNSGWRKENHKTPRKKSRCLEIFLKRGASKVSFFFERKRSYRVIAGTGFVHPIHRLDTHQVNQQNSIHLSQFLFRWVCPCMSRQPLRVLNLKSKKKTTKETYTVHHPEV